MNLLASAIKSASYDDLTSLAATLIETWTLDRDVDGFGEPQVTRAEMADAINDWADRMLELEKSK